MKKLRLCTSCLDADFILIPGVGHDNCPVKVNEPKKFYSCVQKDCMTHYLVCVRHKDENKKKMDKSKEFWSRKGVSFSYHSSKPSKASLKQRMFSIRKF